MKIGLISDLHANPYALEAVFRHLQAEPVEKILCAGDLTGYSPLVNETFEILTTKDIEYIIGNHDHYVLTACPDDKNAIVKECISRTRAIISRENLDFLRSLDTSKLTEVDGRLIKLVHGSPFDLLEEYVYPDKQIDPDDYRLDAEDLLVLGHTHHQMIKTTPGFAMVNPGSTGQPRDARGHACFGIYDTASGQARLVRLKYDTRDMIRALEKAAWPAPLLKYF